MIFDFDSSKGKDSKPRALRVLWGWAMMVQDRISVRLHQKYVLI